MNGRELKGDGSEGGNSDSDEEWEEIRMPGDNNQN